MRRGLRRARRAAPLSPTSCSRRRLRSRTRAGARRRGCPSPPDRRRRLSRRVRWTRNAARNTRVRLGGATPTYASYLNRIEATFGAIDEFVCKNADYLDWDAFGYALAEHVRHRNSPAERAQRKLDAAKRRQRRAVKPTSELKLAA